MANFNVADTSDLNQSIAQYSQQGLVDSDICRYIVPNCMGQQFSGSKVMENIGNAFRSLSQNNVLAETTVNEMLVSREIPKPRMGVASMEPKSIFSLQMLLRMQNEAVSGTDTAVKANNAFKSFLSDPENESKLSSFGRDLQSFAVALV